MSGVGERVELVRRSAAFERLRARLPRYLLVGTLVVTSLIGIRELVSPSQPAAAPNESSRPDHALEEFAQGFAQAYLTYDSERPEARELALAGYVSDGVNAGAGLTPSERSSQVVVWTRVAQNPEALAGGRIVVVAVGIDGAQEPLYLAVPVDRLDEGAIVLSGYPSLVGPPETAVIDPPEREAIEAADVAEVAERVIRNYLAGERQNLAADLATGASVSMPSQRLEVDSIEEIVWADGPDSGAVLATVVAIDESRTTWTLTYELGVERASGRVLVSFIETLSNET